MVKLKKLTIMNEIYDTYFLFRDNNFKQREEVLVDGERNLPFPEYWNVYLEMPENSLFSGYSVPIKLTLPFISHNCQILNILEVPLYSFWPHDNNMYAKVESLQPIQIRMDKMRRFYKKRNADVYIIRYWNEKYELMNLHTKKTINITSDTQNLETLIQSFGWYTDEYLTRRNSSYPHFDLMQSIREAMMLGSGDIEDFFKYAEMPDVNKELCWAA